MSIDKCKGGGSGGGCLEVVLIVVLVIVLCSQFKTPWGTFEIDLIPAAVRQVEAISKEGE